MPGLETLFAALYTGMVSERGLNPCRVAALPSERPARHFGLYPRKGALTPGANADFVIVSARPWTFDAASMASKVTWSPYDGMTFGARVAGTYVRGTPVYAEGRVTGAPGTGTFIRPA